MDLLPLVLTFTAAYGVFMILAYMLAKVFFPTIDSEEPEARPRRERIRHPRRFAGRSLR